MEGGGEFLGVSVEAISKWVHRGSIRSDKGKDDRQYVYLDEVRDTADPRSEDQGYSSPLVDELRDRVRSLEEQLQEERRANDENRRLLAAALERIPALEAPASSPGTEQREAPPEATEQPGRVEPQPAGGGAQEGSQRASWWRRIFGEGG